MLTIHNFARGVRGLRVMWLCEEMGLPYEVKYVTFPPSAAYRALHPPGSVPYLQDDTAGVGLAESVAILLYLANRYGPTPLLPPRDAPQLARVLHLAEFGESEVGAGMNTLLAARFMAPAADKDNWSVRAQRARLERALGYLANALGDQEFLAGTGLTLADISVAPTLGLFQGVVSVPLPAKLDTYRQRLQARPAWQLAQVRCQGEQPAPTP
ncbi:MAG TPA: glutathione S-transferase family protein [Steroidobacteraceae bacterium]|jgi:glutathione S-transferase